MFFFPRRDRAVVFFPEAGRGVFFFFPRRDGAIVFFFRGGTGRLYFFFEAGRDGVVVFFQRRDRAVVFFVRAGTGAENALCTAVLLSVLLHHTYNDDMVT